MKKVRKTGYAFIIAVICAVFTTACQSLPQDAEAAAVAVEDVASGTQGGDTSGTEGIGNVLSQYMSGDVSKDAADPAVTPAGEGSDGSTSSENAADGTSSGNDAAYNEEEAELTRSGELSDKALEILSERLGKDNNGFFTCTYVRPEEIVWGSVLYNGGGIDTELSKEEEEAFKETVNGEILTDITAIRGEDLKEYVEDTTGTSYDDAICPIGWTYLEDFDLYCFEHGDTNYIDVSFKDGSYDDGVYTLHYDGYDDLYEPCRLEAKVRRLDDGSYNFISNIPSTWDGNDVIAGAYGGILRKYYRCLAYERSYEYLDNQDVNTHCVFAYSYADAKGGSPLEYVGYDLRDINGDGKDELFIGPMDAYGSTFIYQIYTLSDDLPKLLIDCSYRGYVHLLPDNGIYVSNASTMYNFDMHLYHLDEHSDDLIEDAGYYMEDTSYYDDDGKRLYYKKVIKDRGVVDPKSEEDERWRSIEADEYEDADLIPEGCVKLDWTSIGSIVSGDEAVKDEDASDKETNAEGIAEDDAESGADSGADGGASDSASEDKAKPVKKDRNIMSHLIYNGTLGETNKGISWYDSDTKHYTDAYVFYDGTDLRLGRLETCDSADEAVDVIAKEMDVKPSEIECISMDEALPNKDAYRAEGDIYKLRYTAGENEDLRECNDMIFLEDDALLWFHSGIPADLYEQYVDQVMHWEDGLCVDPYGGSDCRGSYFGKSIIKREGYLTDARSKDEWKFVRLDIKDVLIATESTPERMEISQRQGDPEEADDEDDDKDKTDDAAGDKDKSGDAAGEGDDAGEKKDDGSVFYLADKGSGIFYVMTSIDSGGYLDSVRVAGDDFVKLVGRKGVGKGKDLFVSYSYDPIADRVIEIRERNSK